MRKILNIFSVAVFFLSSCASVVPVYKQDYDFSKIKTVFVEDSAYSNIGGTIRNAVIKQLMTKGFYIKDSDTAGIDAVVSVSVYQYQPSKTYLIRENNPGASNVVVYNNDPFELSGSTLYDSGSAFGIKDTKLFSSTASVGLSISVKDPKTDEIIWTSSYTYEGFDIDSSIEGAVKFILKSFPPQKPNKGE
ncbi:MAG: DUF4136 domain-containing protein [Endomicrobiaceae bacterium]|jgi:hypothetical protein|nr:DUF4136 domain-containing protein [Endomicrobiaceae bacterium]